MKEVITVARTTLIVVDGQERGRLVKKHTVARVFWTIFCVAAVIGLLASI